MIQDQVLHLLDQDLDQNQNPSLSHHLDQDPDRILDPGQNQDILPIEKMVPLIMIHLKEMNHRKRIPMILMVPKANHRRKKC